MRDPQTNLAAITRVDRASDVYQGPYAQDGPDLIVGYNRGYRAGWQTILGNFPADVFEDNSNPWSGDHCMDYTLVPGVLLSNRPIDALIRRSLISRPPSSRNLESPGRAV